MKWFTGITAMDALRHRYKELLMKYHPDNQDGADTTAIMQEINAEYDSMLARFRNGNRDKRYSRDTGDTGSGGKRHDASQSFDEATEREIRRILNELVRMKGDFAIELVGTWIWCYGPGIRDSPEVRKKLKELGFHYARKKQKWHWGATKGRSRRPVPMGRIRAKYGSTLYRKENGRKRISG